MNIGGISFGGGGFGDVLDYGAALSFSFAPVNPMPSFIWTGAATVGRIAGGWPPGWGGIDSYGSASNLIDRLYARMGIGAPSAPPEKKKVPQGTDSKNTADRGRSYIRERIGNGKELPTQTDVLSNIYGDKVDDSTWNDAKKNDKALRTITEKIVKDWINDPKARTEFIRKWDMAKNDADRVAALADPRGDGGYLQHLSEFVSGLQNGNDFSIYKQNMEKIANWFATNFDQGTIFAMGDETAGIVRSLGIGSSTPIANKEEYIGKLVDKGYSREEVQTIASAFDSKELADEAMRRIERQGSDINEIKAIKEDKIQQLRQRLSEAKKDEDKKEIQRQIDALQKQYDRAQEARAQRFMQDYMKVVESHFGHTPQELGYEAGKLPAGVKDVPTAVVWIQNQLRGLGHNVEVPELSPEEVPPTVEPAKAPVKKAINPEAALKKKIIAAAGTAAGGGGNRSSTVDVLVDDARYSVGYEIDGGKFIPKSITPKQ